MNTIPINTAGFNDRPALAQRAGEPVYLETPKPENVTLYRTMGFEVIDERVIESSTLQFHSMLKRP